MIEQQKNNHDMIGTRLILGLSYPEPIKLGKDIGTRLNLHFPETEEISLLGDSPKQKVLVKSKQQKRK